MVYLANFVKVFLALSITIFTGGASAADKVAQYSVREDSVDKLIATYDGQEYWLTNKQDEKSKYSLEGMRSVYLHEQGDFDGDGNEDLLFTATNGGASAVGRYFVASHHGDHYFTIASAEELYTYGVYELLEQDDGSIHIKVYHALHGNDLYEGVDGFSIYKLRSGKLQLISSVISHAQIPVMMEILASEFEGGGTTFEFDIDGDGTPDQLLCSYWARWGAVGCDIELSTIGLVEHNWGGNQIGIAETKTNGVHDLVYNWVGLMKFDGIKFVQSK